MSPSYHISAWRAATLLKETKPQLVYLNSFFDYHFTILPLLITRITSRKTPVLLAPRGEMSVGALALKWQKKRVFIAAFRLLGLHKAVAWHASTSQEKADIERMFGADAMSHVAINLRADLAVAGRTMPRAPARHGSASLLPSLLLRIVPKKNVATVIKALPLLKGKVHLSIAGPIRRHKVLGRMPRADRRY